MARVMTMPRGIEGQAPNIRAVTTGTNGGYHTRLHVDTVLPAIAGGADLAVGVLAFTYPAGVIVHDAASINIALQQTEGNVDADTPDIGLGTTIASGAVAVLGGTAAFENMLTGQTAADCDGTATVATLGTQLIIAADGDKTVYLNVADGWAADGEAAMVVTGTIDLWWRLGA